MGYRLRVMTAADIPAGMRLKEIAGWNQTQGDWERFLRASPEGCFVAEVEGRVLGTAATIVYESRFAWIGMVLVDPVTRGQGIGTELLRETIGYLDACRIPCMKLDATPQGKPIYEKLGFVSEYEVERWVLRRSPLSGAVAEPGPGELEEVFALDREIFGADRSDLLRSVALEAPAFAMQERSQGRLSGYAFGRQGSRADHLGPWVTLDEASARSLLGEFLRRSRQQMVFVDGMKPSPWAIELLGENGFAYARPLTRMYRGRNDFPGRPELQGAILGPEFG
jgi:GNAT superfamily N-acetyltransferase